MSSNDENTLKKRGRPKKTETILGTMTRKEYDHQRYQQQKSDRASKYLEERDDKIAYAKLQQTKYRESYKMLKYLYENGKILTNDGLNEDIKKILE